MLFTKFQKQYIIFLYRSILAVYFYKSCTGENRAFSGTNKSVHSYEGREPVPLNAFYLILIMIGYIYKSINTVNTKIYVGQRKSEKFLKNYFGSGKLIRRAINKYGKNKFLVELVKSCETIKDLNKWEIYYIEYFHSTDIRFGYNISKGGTAPMTGLSFSEESKKKMKESHIGHIPWNKGLKMGPLSEERRKDISKKSKGRKHTEETKNKLRIINTGKRHTEETKLKMSKKQKGKHRSEEVKKRMSEAQKKVPRNGIPRSEETKNKISNALKGRYVGDKNPWYGKSFSEETLKIMSDLKKGIPLSESHKKHISESNKGKRKGPLTEEQKEKIRIGNIGKHSKKKKINA